jgi:signal transduction histidine kinase
MLATATEVIESGEASSVQGTTFANAVLEAGAVPQTAALGNGAFLDSFFNVLKKLSNLLPQSPPREWLVALSVLAICLVGCLDYVTDTAVSLPVLYMPPVALAAWYGGRRAGIFASLLATFFWFAVQVVTAESIWPLAAHYWNAALRFVTYLLVTALVDLVRSRRDALEVAVQQKTALLQREVQERARIERDVMNICAHEQQRIACDLHDELGQHLVGVALRAKLLAQQLTGRHMAEAIAVVQLVNEATKQVRSITRNLDCAEGITDLRTGLHKLATKVGQNCQVTIMLNTNGTSLPMNTRVAVQLYRLAQEAVRNAVEHGKARAIEIKLAHEHDQTLLTVRDDGAGFDEQKICTGMGLRIMRYRAHCIGGSVDIHSRPGRTTVTCRVPQTLGVSAEEDVVARGSGFRLVPAKSAKR